MFDFATKFKVRIKQLSRPFGGVRMAFLNILFIWMLLYIMSDIEDQSVNASLCAQSRMGWWKCSPCGFGTRCLFCNWCLAFCYNCDWKKPEGRSDTGQNDSVKEPVYGEVDVPYKVSFMEMLEDIKIMLENDEISDTDVVEIFKMTADATKEDSKLCNNSLEIEEVSNMTQSFHLQLKNLIGKEEFNSVALNMTIQTNAVFESFPETLLGRVETNSAILSGVPQSDLGIMLTGSGAEPDSKKAKSVEVLNINGTHRCSLPDLAHKTWGHTQNGLTLCGGTAPEIRSECRTFTNGFWTLPQNLTRHRSYHTSWHSSKGFLLMGGTGKLPSQSIENLDKSLDTNFTKFHKSYRFIRHCAIVLELEDKVILTGGQLNSSVNTTTPSSRVVVYSVNGNGDDLPDLLTGRYLHGCSHYINSDNKQVSPLLSVVFGPINCIFRC